MVRRETKVLKDLELRKKRRNFASDLNNLNFIN